MTDIEIAKNVKLEKIEDIAKKLNIDEDDIECYGKYKAKISNEIYKKLENNTERREGTPESGSYDSNERKLYSF